MDSTAERRMIRVSCSVKLHSFHLAEQLDRKSLLNSFYTIYHSRKDPLIAAFNSRRDAESIDLNRVTTFAYLAPFTRLRNDPYANNALFDSCVASRLKQDKNYEVFIGWSGMSINSIRQAKRDGKKVVIERGSSHIRYQFTLLKDEYERWGFKFRGDERMALQEEMEYDMADQVVIASEFVAGTFRERGFPQNRIFKNNFGSSSFFKPSTAKREKFTIMYAGNLSLRKGLPYFFQALSQLDIDPNLYDVWFVGSVADEIKKLVSRFRKDNWKFFGHLPQRELSGLMSQASIAVQPSLEEGLSMVIPQFLACGTPVIATTNTGGGDIIKDTITGYVIPVRAPEVIVEKVSSLFHNRNTLSELQQNAVSYSKEFGTWDHYGNRYAEFLLRLVR